MMQLLIITVIMLAVSCNTKESKEEVPAPEPIKHRATNDGIKVQRVRFPFAINFTAYKESPVSVQNPSIDLSTSRTARQFGTIIRTSIKQQGLNFGGHYNLTRWGCGTSCQSGAITEL